MSRKVPKTKWHSLDEKAKGTPSVATSTALVYLAPNRLVSIVFSVGTLLGFLLLWTKALKPEVEDPWMKGLRLTSLSTEISSPGEKSQLLKQAEEVLKEAVSQHPYHARIWFIYGFYFLQKQMWDSVIACERKAIELGKGGQVNQVEFEASDMLCYAVSMKLNSIKDKNGYEPVSVLKSSEVNDFDNRCLIKLQGAAYTNLGQTDSALFYLNRAASMQPDAEVYFNIALNYLKKGIKEKAIEELNKALSLNKDYEPAKTMLQKISIKTQ
jgi:tetratricopeptide (TPR) repeat protein